VVDEGALADSAGACSGRSTPQEHWLTQPVPAAAAPLPRSMLVHGEGWGELLVVTSVHMGKASMVAGGRHMHLGGGGGQGQHTCRQHRE